MGHDRKSTHKNIYHNIIAYSYIICGNLFLFFDRPNGRTLTSVLFIPVIGPVKLISPH
jgi:hypothetical protein